MDRLGGDHQCDRQTDEQTDRITIAIACALLRALINTMQSVSRWSWIMKLVLVVVNTGAQCVPGRMCRRHFVRNSQLRSWNSEQNVDGSEDDDGRKDSKVSGSATHLSSLQFTHLSDNQ